jgi:hypothetical protein
MNAIDFMSKIIGADVSLACTTKPRGVGGYIKNIGHAIPKIFHGVLTCGYRYIKQIKHTLS